MRVSLKTRSMTVSGLLLLLASCGPPQTVDPLATLGVAPPDARGSIQQLRGQPVTVVLGPNLIAGAEYGKSARESAGTNPLTAYFVGGKEQTDALYDSNAPVVSVAAMLKAHFPQIRLAKTIAEAEATSPAAIVLVDLTWEQPPGMGSTVTNIFGGRFDFIMPFASRKVHRTIDVSHRKACPAPSWSAGGSTYNVCFLRTREEMLTELRNKLDAAMRGE